MVHNFQPELLGGVMNQLQHTLSFQVLRWVTTPGERSAEVGAMLRGDGPRAKGPDPYIVNRAPPHFDHQS